MSLTLCSTCNFSIDRLFCCRGKHGRRDSSDSDTNPDPDASNGVGDDSGGGRGGSGVPDMVDTSVGRHTATDNSNPNQVSKALSHGGSLHPVKDPRHSSAPIQSFATITPGTLSLFAVTELAPPRVYGADTTHINSNMRPTLLFLEVTGLMADRFFPRSLLDRRTDNLTDADLLDPQIADCFRALCAKAHEAQKQDQDPPAPARNPPTLFMQVSGCGYFRWICNSFFNTEGTLIVHYISIAPDKISYRDIANLIS